MKKKLLTVVFLFFGLFCFTNVYAGACSVAEQDAFGLPMDATSDGLYGYYPALNGTGVTEVFYTFYNGWKCTIIPYDNMQSGYYCTDTPENPQSCQPGTTDPALDPQNIICPDGVTEAPDILSCPAHSFNEPTSCTIDGGHYWWSDGGQCVDSCPSGTTAGEDNICLQNPVGTPDCPDGTNADGSCIYPPPRDTLKCPVGYEPVYDPYKERYICSELVDQPIWPSETEPAPPICEIQYDSGDPKYFCEYDPNHQWSDPCQWYRDQGYTNCQSNGDGWIYFPITDGEQVASKDGIDIVLQSPESQPSNDSTPTIGSDSSDPISSEPSGDSGSSGGSGSTGGGSVDPGSVGGSDGTTGGTTGGSGSTGDIPDEPSNDPDPNAADSQNLSAIAKNTSITAQNTQVTADNTNLINNNAAAIADNTQISAANSHVIADNTKIISDDLKAVVINTKITADNTDTISSNTSSTAKNQQITADNTKSIADNQKITADNVKAVHDELKNTNDILKRIESGSGDSDNSSEILEVLKKIFNAIKDLMDTSDDDGSGLNDTSLNQIAEVNALQNSISTDLTDSVNTVGSSPVQSPSVFNDMTSIFSPAGGSCSLSPLIVEQGIKGNYSTDLLGRFCELWDNQGGREFMGWFFYSITVVACFMIFFAPQKTV